MEEHREKSRERREVRGRGSWQRRRSLGQPNDVKTRYSNSGRVCPKLGASFLPLRPKAFLCYLSLPRRGLSSWRGKCSLFKNSLCHICFVCLVSLERIERLEPTSRGITMISAATRRRHISSSFNGCRRSSALSSVVQPASPFRHSIRGTTMLTGRKSILGTTITGSAQNSAVGRFQGQHHCTTA